MDRKEAIEVIKKYWPDSSFTRLRNALETLIPELKESEDEIWIDRACMLLDELNHLSTLTLAKIPSNVNDIISHLKSVKKRVQPQPKQEWSEEDEKALGNALWCCKQAASIAKDENDMGNVWYAERWLKALKERMEGE